eukprot:TRINITY_DN26626_c0_g1_i2.p1 TRINITY_DN26626_c0_g1~~TRINITY_DN26626_c0_g1_i2.p1  ORF type:complete len:242 (+),score=49.37 TRINITY_DN26626_c0_g1_i2:62-787(+)
MMSRLGCLCDYVMFSDLIYWFMFEFFFFLMIRRPPRSTLSSSSAASDVYKRQGVFNGHTPDSHGPRREVHTPQSLETHARTPPPAIQQSPLPRHPDQRRDVSINNASVKSTIDVVTVVQPQQQLPHQPITLPQRSSVESFDESSNGGQVGEDPALASLRNTLAQLLRHQRQLLDQFEGSKGDYEEAVNIRMSLERAANNEEKEHARLVAMEEEEIARAEAKLQGLKTENRQLRSDLRRIAA